MSRLAGFYIARAMESVTAGTAASAIPPRRAGVHAALDAIDTDGRGPSTSHRVAAVRRFIGGLDIASRRPANWAISGPLRQSPHGSHQHVTDVRTPQARQLRTFTLSAAMYKYTAG
jgi:hypothetical protein